MERCAAVTCAMENCSILRQYNPLILVNAKLFLDDRRVSAIWLEETRRSSKNHLAENDWGGLTVTEFRSPHGMEEGKGKRYLASGRQYGNALLYIGVRHQEEEC